MSTKENHKNISQKGKLYKQLLNEYTYKDDPAKVAQQAFFNKIKPYLDGMQTDFPIDLKIWLPWAKSYLKNLPEDKNPNPFCTDHANMIVWFAKWMGED